MDRITAIARLPEPYAIALVLHDRGRDDIIPECLGVEPEGVPALLELAEAKLGRLLEGVG